MPKPEMPVRVLNRDGSFNTSRFGIKHRIFTDTYHRILTLRTRTFLLGLVSTYIAVNLVFGVGYYLCGSAGVEGLRDGNYFDAFFFSVQTLATIGYGKLVPISFMANMLVTFEALIGLLGLALATGLMFARFSRPTARVVFSRVATVVTHQGNPTLIFRMANERMNQIVEAHVNVVFIATSRTPEGETFRMLNDLPLVRNHSPLFAATWSVMHKIDEKSPFHNKTADELSKMDAEILISFTGMDDTFNQTVHTRFSYTPTEIVWNHRFVDILAWTPEGTASIDLTRIHDTKPIST